MIHTVFLRKYNKIQTHNRPMSFFVIAGTAEGLEQMAKALAQMGMSDADIKKALELAKNS